MSAKRILVADDDAVTVQLLTAALRGSGYQVITARDAMQAVMAAQRSLPDAIILDILMPAGTGINVLQRIQSSSHTQVIPVIVITGSPEADVEQKTRALGARAFFRKPLDTTQILKLLGEMLADQQQGGQPPA
jgi:CheY-like chemotaxis protein